MWSYDLETYVDEYDSRLKAYACGLMRLTSVTDYAHQRSTCSKERDLEIATEIVTKKDSIVKVFMAVDSDGED